MSTATASGVAGEAASLRQVGDWIGTTAGFRRAFALVAIAATTPFLSACTGLYFHDAGVAPQPPPRYELDRLPFDEYWTGLVFNGNKIGFTRFEISALGEDEYEVRSEASMRFRFLTIDKSVTLHAVDRIGSDLALRRFHYRYDLDGNQLELRGQVEQGRLEVDIINAGVSNHQSYPLHDTLYPTSVAALYPVVHGLEPGRRFAYTVFDGETQSISRLEQRIVGFQISNLFEGPAYRLVTRLHGHRVITWLDLHGLPVLETAQGGVLVAGLEEPAAARRYLALAALNKNEDLVGFSRVPARGHIASPRETGSLVASFSGFDGFVVPSDGRQTCRTDTGHVHCSIDSQASPRANDDAERYLRSTLPVPSRDPRIRTLAAEITRGLNSDEARIEALLAWIQTHVEQQAVDVFSALDVLETRKAECQGNSYLYAAFARSLGIPTRVVNGLVYSELVDGFLYHTWSESVIAGHWHAVDPTFGQFTADATHLKLVEGEMLADLTPIIAVMGRLAAEIESAR